VPSELAAFLAVYAAVVSTALGVLRWIEFGESRRRIVFSVVLSEIVEPILVSLGGSKPRDRRRRTLLADMLPADKALPSAIVRE